MGVSRTVSVSSAHSNDTQLGMEFFGKIVSFIFSIFGLVFDVLVCRRTAPMIKPANEQPTDRLVCAGKSDGVTVDQRETCLVDVTKVAPFEEPDGQDDDDE